jgi:hypothetical protein
VTTDATAPYRRAVTCAVTGNYEKGGIVPLIAKEKKEVLKPVTVKLEEGLAARFIAYAEYLESSKDHVVAEALKYVMDRDREFAAHLAVKGKTARTESGTAAAKPKSEEQ